ncbi:ureidoglycolate hydrolase [Hylemonella gracilis str. Niagara R]|uniref:Ureidoglycolate hydrolase n=1 Tax=Hylemonella gracilis str. Niagara R TaxID=1458275 RepID=A0A016XGN0_9BURK|nr:ureidoglycolate lyase [Hylemonella gracilis]EYC50373.1 ureidoglycolate hydrolase [Hylemonella gracilis str. Niagara R]
MNPVLLRPAPLSASAFAPFGLVIQHPGGPGRVINAGSAQRWDLGELSLHAHDGRAALALFRAHARAFPQTLTVLERHALGSQAFIPLGLRRFVIVVAPAGAAPRAQDLSAFITDGQQGIVLAPGVWHHALLAVDAGDFVVIERAASAVDCDEVDLPQPMVLALA